MTCEQCKLTRENEHYNVHSMGCAYCMARSLWKIRIWWKKYPERRKDYEARVAETLKKLSWYGLEESKVQELSKIKNMPIEPEERKRK